MADAVGCVTEAVELALKIKDAVDTVRQNRKDCAHIKRRAERVRHTLSLCEGNAELMESPAVRDAVEALAEVLGEALGLVTGCQEETNAVCLYCTAGKLSKQLSKVDRGISDGNSEATFAILVYHISKQTGDGAPPPPAIPTETVEIPEVLVNERLDQIAENLPSGDFYVGRPCEDGSGDDGALLQEIAKVTLAIRTATETVCRNKEECVEINKIASRANLLMSQLEGTEMKKDAMVIVALKNLLRTFRYAHGLVTACQRRSVLVLCSAGKLSSELGGVWDEMMLGLDDLIEVLR